MPGRVNTLGVVVFICEIVVENGIRIEVCPIEVSFGVVGSGVLFLRMTAVATVMTEHGIRKM